MERYSDQWKRKYKKKRAKHKKIMYGVGATGLLTLSILLCISQGGSKRFGADAANPNQIEQNVSEESNLDPLQKEPISMEKVDLSINKGKEVKKETQNSSLTETDTTSSSDLTEKGNASSSDLASEGNNSQNNNQEKENVTSIDSDNKNTSNQEGQKTSTEKEESKRTIEEKTSNEKTNSSGETNSKENATEADNELEEQFFKDTIFIGDSRSEGLGDFGKVKGAEFYTYRGLMVNTAIGKNYIKLNNGNMGNVLDAAKQTSFSKVYLLFGINELGWRSLDIFKENYRSIIEGLREIEPDCEIFIQSNYPVTKKMDVGDKVYNNTNIRKFNKVIKELAEEEEVAYIDLYSYFSDKEGNLPEKATPDGIHLNVSYFKDWKQCLMEFGDGNTER